MSLKSFESEGYSYFELHIACPVCRERGITTPQTGWIDAHNNCGGIIYVGENAYYCCEYGHTAHIRECKYKCPSHSTSDDEYIGVGSSAAITEVMSCAGQMVSEVGQKWLVKFLENLGDW